jgi:predicted nucleotidyltransferase component of viral defense system
MLAEETKKAWEALREQPLLDGFVLIGGTALALHIGHRISEDLDFACTEINLPRQRLERLTQVGETFGLKFERNDDPLALDDFLNAGLDLADSQQDMIVNGAVKVSFFVPSPATMNVIKGHGRKGCVQIASIEELFMTKALVAAKRSKTRDWFDLYILLTEHGYTADDFINAFLRNDAKMQLDTALQRLASGIPDPNDESYLSVTENPPTLGKMRDFFRQFRNEVELRVVSR